ncbi:helix-turn-helix domain-containing protein [Winslowiella iniecta]|uniref:helix-turn-helix domain-containing protein n=1 Tax=Winslowiella iniecta TaxID=1560201 RepID=UPI00069F84D2|nr:helix-turn-helix domain-containing protein [Winslowiella iniecta]
MFNIMSEQFLGYYIIFDNGISMIFVSHSGSLIRLEEKKTSSIKLKGTNKLLLEYLLRNGFGETIKKEDLLRHVWDENNLSSSSQRMWQVFKSLKSKIAILNCPADFIVYTKGVGYSIENVHVSKLWYNV